MYDDDPIARRRAARRRQARTRAVVGTVVLALLVAGIVAGVVVVRNRRLAGEGGAGLSGGSIGNAALDGAPAGKDKADWNHADLAAHLKARGVAAKVEGGGLSGVPNSLLSVLVDVATGERVPVHLTPSDVAARDAAAAMGDRATAWGRFVIVRRHAEDADLHRRVLAALR